MANNIKALIVDDERDAVLGLKTMLNEFCQGVVVAGEAFSAIEAVKLIPKIKPDVVFLDVEMSGGSGFDLLEALPEKDFCVIFTTAHNVYAIKAIKNSALDYLLKPINPEELQISINKVKELIASGIKNKFKEHKIKLADASGIVFVLPDNIIYIEASGRYSVVYLNNGNTHVITKNIREFEEELTPFRFFRVHKSFLVNCKHVSKIIRIDGGLIELSNGKQIEVSRRKKAEFISVIRG